MLNAVETSDLTQFPRYNTALRGSSSSSWLNTWSDEQLIIPKAAPSKGDALEPEAGPPCADICIFEFGKHFLHESVASAH